MSRDLSRRKMVAALGIGAVGAVAGCIGAPVNAEPTSATETTPAVAPELDRARDVDTDRIAADPADVPAPVDWDEPREHDITLRTKDRLGPIDAEVGETVRVFFVNGGPNQSSSWHPIGNVWSRLYRDGDLVSPPGRYVETTAVPPGTATVGEMEPVVSGPIKIVDHALSRAGRRGALAVVDVRGEANPDVYDPATGE